MLVRCSPHESGPKVLTRSPVALRHCVISASHLPDSIVSPSRANRTQLALASIFESSFQPATVQTRISPPGPIAANRSPRGENASGELHSSVNTITSSGPATSVKESKLHIWSHPAGETTASALVAGE